MALWEKYLQKIYYDPSNAASFAGPEKLYAFAKRDGKYKLSKYKIRKWLQNKDFYSMQRPIIRPKNRTRIIVAGFDDQWSVDLMDMVKFNKYNDGYSYVLVVIDIFSKYVWLRKLKDKKGDSVAFALKDIIKGGRKPIRIRTNKGQEFRSKSVQRLFKSTGIRHFYALNEVKVAVSERVIKTLKKKIYRYLRTNKRTST
jgi:transposase InsO family protein